MKHKLKCDNFDCPGGGVCRCTMSGGSLCGCNPQITLPPVRELLSPEQLGKQEKRLKKFRKKVCDKSAALVLGAGVSIPAGLPNWVNLISRMMGHAIQYRSISDKGPDNPPDPRVVRLTGALIRGDMNFLSGINTLESAEYVAQFFDDRSLPYRMRQQLPELAMKEMLLRMTDSSLTAEELLAKELLKKRPFSPPLAAPFSGIPDSAADKLSRLPADDLTKKQFAQAFREIQPYLDCSSEPNRRAIAGLNTIFAAAYLIASEQGIHNVMTYNYDPLIEEYMVSLFGIEANQICLHSERWNRDKGKTPDAREIFHVHGFVPGTRHHGAFAPQSERLILSEDSYYDIEQNGAYNWSSSVQSYFLNHYNCIFVGFSAEDYNFKRILRQQGRDRVENKDRYHCLIFTIDELTRNTCKDVCRYHIHQAAKGTGSPADAEEDTKILLQYILRCKERYWRRFGIQPIWTTVADIPELLTGFIS